METVFVVKKMNFLKLLGQHELMLEILNAAKADGPLSDLNFDGVNNEGYWAWRRVGRRLKEISDIFASQMGAAQRNTRFRCVLATQIGNPETMRQGLYYVNKKHGNPSHYFYAVAGVPCKMLLI